MMSQQLASTAALALLVEDDPFMRSAVSDFLQEEMAMTVHTAVSYGEALSKIDALAACDLALVDISLPPHADFESKRQPLGIKLVHKIKQKHSRCGVVLWSAYTHFLRELTALISEGYQGLAYVPKGSRVQVLKTAIERVMQGDVFLHQAVLGGDQSDVERLIVTSLEPEIADIVLAVADGLEELSPRQMQVVERITKTPAAIARDLNLGVRTVRNYQDAIYERLGLRSGWGDVQEIRRDAIITLALLIYHTRQSRAL